MATTTLPCRSSDVEVGEKKRADHETTTECEKKESSSNDSDGTSATGTMDTKEDASKTAKSAPLPSPTYSDNNAIMFDWDDTLLASSFLSARGYRVDSDESLDGPDLTQLRLQEQCVCTLLKLAMTYGPVNIVTNAETGWVQLSAQKFMPSVLPLLAKVNVLSARSTFEDDHPDAPLKWKYFAFQQRLRSMFGDQCMDTRAAEADIAATAAATVAMPADRRRNVLSFGDSHVEREAIRAVSRGVPGWRCASVKFAERPTLEQLRRQLELVTNCFHYVATHTADLDLQLTVTLHPTPPASS